MPEKKNPAVEASAVPAAEASARLDQVIASIEQFYQAVTGTNPPPLGEKAYATIPVERDPGEFVSEQLERLLATLQQPAASAAAAWTPPVSVWESEREMVVCLDLAGVKRDEVDLAVEGNALIVRGRRPASNDGLSLRLSERPLGPFERRVLLPRRVNPAEPDAQLRDGVLEIRMTKLAPEAAGRREVRVG